MNDILYIGLHGYAGSGKDTVAKALRLMLSYNWKSFDDFKATWEREAFKFSYATFSGENYIEDGPCFCIAFADQLKYVCSAMYGIPVEHFYYNKENAWVAINDNFEYTERPPREEDRITADEYYYAINSNGKIDEKKWMSLRELLVYTGTYVCQQLVNRNVFINGVRNKVKMVRARNKNLKYVICTDVRFCHELDFIREQHGINIDIIRSDVKQLDNIAEHDFDDADDMFDFTIDNDGTYDELLHNLWDTVHDNVVFKNNTIRLMSHDDTENYLRQESDNEWRTCFANGTLRVGKDHGSIVMIDPSGGPMLRVGDKLSNLYGESVGIITSIDFIPEISDYVIRTSGI